MDTHLPMRSTKLPSRIPFRVPCVINVRDLPPAQVDDLIESMTQNLGAQYFRDKDLFMAVLDDQFETARQPRSFLYGPYIKLTWVPSGDLRITSCAGMEDGETCYAIDQLNELVNSGEAAEQIGYAAPSCPEMRMP
jgi:hypothetical protein